MKQLNERQLQTHVPITGWLFVAYSLLHIVMGLFAFALIMSGSVLWTGLGQVGPAATDPEAIRVFAMLNTLTIITATLIGGLVVGLAIPGLVAGLGLIARKSWARIFGVVVSALMLFAFPVGTLVGVYAIFVLMQDAAPNYFASPPARLQTAANLA